MPNIADFKKIVSRKLKKTQEMKMSYFSEIPLMIPPFKLGSNSPNPLYKLKKSSMSVVDIKKDGDPPKFRYPITANQNNGGFDLDDLTMTPKNQLLVNPAPQGVQNEKNSIFLYSQTHLAIPRTPFILRVEKNWDEKTNALAKASKHGITPEEYNSIFYRYYLPNYDSILNDRFDMAKTLAPGRKTPLIYDF